MQRTAPLLLQTAPEKWRSLDEIVAQFDKLRHNCAISPQQLRQTMPCPPPATY
jgi:hypothetical protein